ncbi:MAG: hypothetical protein ACKO0Z_02275 [Betaproteobacteria bacterium]
MVKRKRKRPRRPRNFFAHHLTWTCHYSSVDLQSETERSVEVNITTESGALLRARIETPTLIPAKRSLCYELYHITQVIADIQQGVSSGSLLGSTTTGLCTSSWAAHEVRNG